MCPRHACVCMVGGLRKIFSVASFATQCFEIIANNSRHKVSIAMNIIKNSINPHTQINQSFHTDNFP